MNKAAREIVVLVHGLWLGAWSMALVRRRIAQCGYDVRRFSYKTVRADFRENAEDLQAFLAELPRDATVHLVGYSLGGLIIRALFHYFPDQRPGRIVNLGSPHLGSHAANQFARFGGRPMLGRSIGELMAGRPQTWNPPGGRDIGVLAGDVPIGIGRLFPGLPKPNDGTVSVAETRWPLCTDHIILHVTHWGMLLSRDVVSQTCHFLRAARFGRR